MFAHWATSKLKLYSWIVNRIKFSLNYSNIHEFEAFGAQNIKNVISAQ